MANRNARVILSAQDKASRVILGVRKNLKGLAAIAAGLGAFVLGRKLVQGVKASIATFKEWDFQTSRTAGVLGKTRKEIEALEKQSKLLGRTTQFTARDVAEGQFTMAKAGFKVNEITAAMAGNVNLAAAANTSLGNAADISAGLIRAFHLEAGAAVDVADLLAVAANSANTTIEEMAEGFKFVAPAATGLGIDLSEVSAAMGVLSDNMLGGSIGGTGLRKTFTTLLGSVNKLEGATGLGGLQERFDELRENGASLHDILVFLRDEVGVNSSNAYKIFGDRAGNVAKVLIENIDKFDELSVAIADRHGKAMELAIRMNDNLEGDTKFLTSAMEGLRMEIGDRLNPGLRTLTQQMTDVTNSFTDTAEEGNALTDVLDSINEGISKLGENAVALADVVQISWAGLGFTFNWLAASAIDVVTTVLGVISKAELALAVFLANQQVMIRKIPGLKTVADAFFGGAILDEGAKAATANAANTAAIVKDLETLRLGFVTGADDIIDKASETSTYLDVLRKRFIALREAQEDEDPKPIPDPGAKGPSATDGGDGTPDPTREDPATAEAIAKKIAEVRIQAQELALDRADAARKHEADLEMSSLVQRHARELAETHKQGQALTALKADQTMERAMLEAQISAEQFSERVLNQRLLLMRNEQALELIDLQENEIAKTELMVVHEDIREELRAEYNRKRQKAAGDLVDAEAGLDNAALKGKKGHGKQLMKEGMAVMGTLFGKSKAFTIASIIMDTAMSVSRALAGPPPVPWSIPFAAIAAAQGAAQLTMAKKQNFKAQFGGVAGVSLGPGGVDNMLGRFSHGELIADTTAAEGRAILSGQAAIVPAGQAGGGGTTVVINGDVLDPEDFFRRHAQYIGRAGEMVVDDGEII